MKDFPTQLDLGFAAGAADIALEAGELLRGYFERGVATEYKGDVDLVTEADRASEKLIVSRLSEQFPDHGIYGEEGTRSGLERAYRWYVDPLDGTTNFSHGFPFFNVSLGLEHRPPGLAPDQDGEIVAGVVYDPVRDELFAAEKGEGAWLRGLQGLSAGCMSRASSYLQESLLSTGFPSHKRHAEPEHPLLPAIDVALSRRPPGWRGGARSGILRGRPRRRLLGIQSEPLGYSGGRVAGDGGGWSHGPLRPHAFSSR